MKCTIIGHNGFTDFFSQYALYKEKISKYDDIIIFVNEESKIPIVKSLFPEKHISVQIPIINNNYDGVNTCINCHTYGAPHQCPRGGSLCKYIDYLSYKEYDNIKLNGFDDYGKWALFKNDKSFLDCFYQYYNLDFIETLMKHKFIIDAENCKQFYDSQLINSDYIVVHDTETENGAIRPSLNKNDTRVICLNKLSTRITDTVHLLQGAKELHVIDSVYGFFILFLQIQYNLFENKNIFLYTRGLEKDSPFFAIQRYIPADWKIINIINVPKNNISVNNFCQSGYGDRMMDLFIYSILSKVYDAKSYLKWTLFTGTTWIGYPPWRFVDTDISLFINFIKLPSYIELVSTDTNHQYTSTQNLGGCVSPLTIYDKNFKNTFSHETYLEIVNSVKKDYSFQFDKYTHSKPYVTVHLRRTDKLQGYDNLQINMSELNDLDMKTFAAIQVAKEKGYTDFYLASDSTDTKKMYTAKLNEMGLHVIQPPNTYNLLESYYDTWIMSSSSLILVSMKYSAFSLFPALYFDIPIYNILGYEPYESFTNYITLIKDLGQLQSL